MEDEHEAKGYFYQEKSNIKPETYNLRGVGAANKAAIQLVKVQPYQLLVSDT
jgi:hypothetical protein